MTTGSVDRAGVRIHYEVSGSGFPVLASHGYSSSSHVWRPLAEVLSPNFKFVAWDMRGHGRSDYPDRDEDYSVPASVEDMRGVLDAAEAEKAVLIGHSLGGFLSLEFQLRHPGRVAGLILVGTGPGYRKDEARAGWNRLADRYAASFEADGLEALSSSGEVSPDVHRDATGLARAARGILRQHDLRVLDHLPLIDVPTLVVVGEDDVSFVPGSRYMATKIPGAELAVIPAAGHSPMTDAPQRFHEVVGSFLDREPWRSQRSTPAPEW